MPINILHCIYVLCISNMLHCWCGQSARWLSNAPYCQSHKLLHPCSMDTQCSMPLYGKLHQINTRWHLGRFSMLHRKEYFHFHFPIKLTYLPMPNCTPPSQISLKVYLMEIVCKASLTIHQGVCGWNQNIGIVFHSMKVFLCPPPSLVYFPWIPHSYSLNTCKPSISTHKKK